MAKQKRKKSVLKIILRIFVLLIIASLAGGYIYTANLMKGEFKRFDKGDPEMNTAYWYDHYEQDYPRQEVSFRSGDNVLKGYIYGLNNDKGVIVFAHGLGGGHESYMSLLTALVDKGWRVFAYDATGSYTSEGEGTVGLAQSCIDLDRALTFVENNSVFSGLPIFVMGHSWGGYASAAVLNLDHDIKGCVSLSGYDTPMAMLCNSADEMMGDKSFIAYPFIWAYNKVHAGRFASLSAVDGLNKSDIPALIIHGDNDDLVKYFGPAIIARKSKIRNQHVEYYVFEAEGKDSHNGFFQTSEYFDYYNDTIKPAYDKLTEKYGNDIPDEEIKNYVASLDRDKCNELNPDLLDLIDEFLERQVSGIQPEDTETEAVTEEAETASTEQAAPTEEVSETEAISETEESITESEE